jgi:integrase
MPKLTNRLPKYRLHRPSGQAVVTLNGFDYYLGIHGSEASKQAYQRKVSEWMASNKLAAAVPSAASDFTVDEVFIRYWAHVTAYYVKDGQPTGEQHALRSALTPVVNLYGPTRAADFGPLQLKAVREWMIKQKLSRRLINQRVNRVRRMFKWAVENAYLNPAILQGLQAVAPLKRGRCEAPDTEPVRPLPEDVLEKTIEHMSPEVAAMARLQWHTGMRPGEVVIMRTRDIDQSHDVWRYRPASHKTQHHGIDRVIPLGPRAKAVVQPYLRDDLDEYLFSPARKMNAWNEERKKKRQTPMTPSQAARTPKRKRKKAPGLHYTTASYGHAIAKACRKAGITVWGPNRLRHSTATRLRNEFGLDHARVILGHRSPTVTEIYAEIDQERAIGIMKDFG